MTRRLLSLMVALAVLLGGLAPATVAAADSQGKAGIGSLDGKNKSGKKKHTKKHGKKHGKKKHHKKRNKKGAGK